jgi:hypothetical protein
MVGVGSIVSVGGTGGGGGSGGSSGIQNLNGQTGPVVTLVGTSGIVIAPVAPNIINIGFNGSTTQSGVLGVNGIDVQQVGGNFIVDGASLSGLGVSKFSSSFSSITSGVFTHSFNTLDVIVQVFDSDRHVIFPDDIIVENGDQVSVTFNQPQTGRVVII